MQTSSTGQGLPWVRFLVVLLLVGADQWTKFAVFDFMEVSPPPADVIRDHHGHLRYPIFGDWFGFMLSYNPGAAFGRLADWPHALVIGRGLAVTALCVLVFRAVRKEPVVLSAMVLVLSGAVGNLLDNLWFGGVEAGHPYLTVRDFIDVWFLSDAFGWDWHFHTFNVADSCISVGAVLWVLSGFFAPKAGAEPAPDDEPEAEALAAAGDEGPVAPRALPGEAEQGDTTEARASS